MVKRRFCPAVLLLPYLAWAFAGHDAPAVEASAATQGRLSSSSSSSSGSSKAAVSPATYYPGWAGGGIYAGGKLCCSRTECSPGWSVYQKGPASYWRHSCTTVKAPNGATCDVNPCIQGLCWEGVCVGGMPAICPAHPQECMQYKCNTRTGQCTDSCPKPIGSPCKGGKCYCGKCIPDPNTCPQAPNKCSHYVFNNATMKCDLVNTTCQQPPETCQMRSCNHRTGLCTVITNKPDGTTCPAGTCQAGRCKPVNCGTKPCPPHNNTCKVFQCDPTTLKCVPVNKPNNTTCPGGSCQNGNCVPAVKCPTTCPTEPCRMYECDLTTGLCSIEVDKPNGSLCPGGTCEDGMCGPEPICPPRPDPCQRYELAPGGRTCILVNETDGTACDDGRACTTDDKCVSGTCTGKPKRCRTLRQLRKPCIRSVCAEPAGNCVNVEAPDNTTCSDGQLCTTDDKCLAGTCVGTPVVCAKRRQAGSCLASSCNPLTGRCQDSPVPDTTPCNDGKWCTINDICVAGAAKSHDKGYQYVVGLHNSGWYD